jgi:hypothetical protein
MKRILHITWTERQFAHQPVMLGPRTIDETDCQIVYGDVIMSKVSQSLWQGSIFGPIYWAAWLAFVPCALFITIPIHRRWGDAAGLGTFFALWLIVLQGAIREEFCRRRKLERPDTIL